MNAHCLEIPTDDATVQPSDVQAGITYYARGEKGVGTGKAFEFANYGSMYTNAPDFVPTPINVIEIASLDYPIRNLIGLNDMKNTDFSIEQTIGIATIDGNEYPITTRLDGVLLTLSCEKEIRLQVFYGKDNYV
jgi:hypothetical protein